MRGRELAWLLRDHMKVLAIRAVTLAIVIMLGVSNAVAQGVPARSTADQTESQATDEGQDQDQGAPPAPAPADPAAVIAQWGPAPAIGPEADKAAADRWFREQNVMRARWGVPTATRDPYLDWMAENRLRDHLGQPQLPRPQGLTPPAVVQRSQSDQGIVAESEFWTVSDDLWQAWLDSFESQPPSDWESERPGVPWFSIDNYLSLFKLQKTPRFDRFRLVGAAGRVNTSSSQPAALLSGESRELEAIAPGSITAYEPLVYPDNLVAVVGSDPWINADGSFRP